MLALGLAFSAVLGLLALWVFAPLFIALVAAALVALPLGRAGQWLWQRHAGRPLPVAGWWAVLVCAGMVCVAVLVLLPERLDGAPFLPLGLGLLAAAWTGALLWCTGWLACGCRPVAEAWWAGAGVGAIAALLAVLLGGPDTAGWMAWRDQLRGYEAVPLRIVLHEAPTPQREQALVDLLQPLLEQGGRAVRHRQSTRFGNSVQQALVPARYRFEGSVLHIMLADPPPAPLLSAQRALLEQFAASGPAQAGQSSSWLMLASAQCLPPPHRRELSRLLGQGSELLARARRCTQQRSAQLQRLWPLLAGCVERVEVGEARRFHPWLGLQRWKAAAAPENQES
ncbi:Uncharacterised protein [Delftia tsuruhatensis]|uniref:hypothetical protein n=1 Tax=Delftia tsuruhatensis TaxID=180282 RepID=UPI001E6CD51E|nr:hypothetical protein [Delftia tsuruhatensis]CAB5683526.1 Uncharacterised protein [Delftia tsuruhatensis]CAC9675924.1 Uncharacterised protein [Delftia tsuruhatensis]